MRVSSRIGLVGVVLSAVVWLSCGGGPAAPEKGTPGWYWQAATEQYGLGNNLKTNQHLASILKSDNEFSGRALPWQLVLSAGMMKGYMDLADNYEYGARAAKANSTPFRRQVNQYRNYANSVAAQFYETYQKFQAGPKDANVTLDFKFPTGSAGQIVEISKIANGIFPAETEIAGIESRVLQRSVLMVTSRAVGAPDDTARAQQIFRTVPVQAPRPAFVLAMAQALADQAQMFSRNKLDLPDRYQFFNKAALDAAKSVPESKQSKELIAKIEKVMKTK